MRTLILANALRAILELRSGYQLQADEASRICDLVVRIYKKKG